MTTLKLVFFLPLMARICYSQDYCRNLLVSPPLIDHALFNHTLQNITDISKKNCYIKCYVNQACRAVNYRKRANLGSCKLLSAKAGSYPKDFLKFPGIDYYETQVCVPNPCPSANMTCIELSGTPRYRCECPQGYTGAACETGYSYVGCFKDTIARAIALPWIHPSTLEECFKEVAVMSVLPHNICIDTLYSVS
ncbi:netrin-G2 [Nematostella vectensis]|uniref:netrin-G2 n=1 Tax=Nematostella vectensis TaxID=45351 RepID=UPI00139025D1|nr:netrin-G2 [Nematostella vectensis]